MKIPALLIALGSCAAGFLIAVLTTAPSSPGEPPSSRAAPIAVSGNDRVPQGPAARAEAARAEIAGDMARSKPLEVAKRWAARDPRAFLNGMRTESPPLDRDITDAFFIAWWNRDPVAAAAVLQWPYQHPSQSYGPNHPLLLWHALLFVEDPLAALDLPVLKYQDSGHGRFRPPELSRLPSPAELEALDPAAVAARLRPEHRAGHYSEAFIKIYIRFLAGKSPDTAIAWIATLPPGVAIFGFKTLVEKAARSSTAEAMAMLDRIPAQFHTHFNDFGNFPWPLARDNPREFLLWLHAHTGRVQKDALGFLCRQWLQKDREAATEWIITHCQPAQRDYLLGRSVSK